MTHPFIEGRNHLLGRLGPVDKEEAARCFSIANEQGDDWAAIFLARLLLDENWISHDKAEAVRLIRPVAERGNPVAQAIWARILRRGNGAPTDKAAAVHWYRKACSAEVTLAEADRSDFDGYLDAKEELADMLFHGEGVAANIAEALEWLRKAAPYSVRARYQLAEWLSAGFGAPVSDREVQAMARFVAPTDTNKKARGREKWFQQAHQWQRP